MSNSKQFSDRIVNLISLGQRFLLLLVLIASIDVPANAQGTDYVKEHYTKYEYMIPMRDGVKLFTAVYVPKDDSKTYPMMLKRTPYRAKPYGTDQYPESLGPSSLFVKDGFIFVDQDVRGRWMSEGEFEHIRPHQSEKKSNEDIDESSDTYDTVDWLIKNVKNNNGKVGIYGISYPGFYTSAGIIDSHPAIKAASPQAPVSEWFIGDDWHHNGAFFMADMFRWMSRNGHTRPEPTKKDNPPFDYGTPDGYEFFRRLKTLEEINKQYFKDDVPFFTDMVNHPNYDAFWKERNILPNLKNIKTPVMTVGGWFDAEDLYGTLQTYHHIEKQNPNTFNILVMGPWQHGGWARVNGDTLGDIPFNSKTSLYYRDKIELAFFKKFLKGTEGIELPEAWVFEMGTNTWRKHAEWPPKEATTKSLYFHGDEQLSFEPSKSSETSKAFDEYVSDPNKPVPYTNKVSTDKQAEYMIADQRFASQRPDVQIYQTEILEKDVTLAGPIEVELFVSTSGTDSDWVVKVVDVYPDDFPDATDNPKEIRMGGYQQLVRGDVFRGRYRNSFEKPEAFTPNEITPVKFTLPDVYHNFRSGHRIMVQVQSSWFPLVDRNPQTFVNIYTAKPSDFQKATQRIYRSAEKPSRITVKVMP